MRFACGGCHKLVTNKGLRSCVNWTGKRCKVIPNQCAVCHELVAGVYVWCQGCGHGGHLEHIEDWLAANLNCPAGCGHSCEYF